ncbi:hypothetical protein RsoM2USA_368 [Ralstonia phage RsoM2USA]|nr:hypothetical protein RsoM2USA_368 [Ralstonia phage RsoM2USA]
MQNDTEKPDVPMQSKKAVVVIGRMNPPTLGHYYLIDKAKRLFKDEKLDGIVVAIVEGTNTSKDKETNPLTADRRIYFMKSSGHCNGVRFVVGKNALDAFFEVRKAGFEPMWIITGDDRGDDYEKLLDKYFKDNDGKALKHKTLVVDREGDDENSGVSATLARSAVEHGMFPEFQKLVDLDEPLAKKMFDEIKKAMGTKEQEDE